MELTDLDIQNLKNQFIELLRSTKREGIENLIKFLEKSDFFTAPSSTRFHGAYKGGLLVHSLNVYNEFIKQINTAIADNKNFYVDQTSLNAAARNKLFSRLIKKPNEIIGIYFTTPLDTILQRNAQRTGRALVPEDVIINMFNSLSKPTLDEGFTEIWEVE